MIEQVLPQIYRIEIPLPHNPLQTLNSYFIRGGERNLLIDTGFNQPQCLAAQLKAKAELGFDMENTDILVTHAHSDHTGLVHRLVKPGAKVFCDAYTGANLANGLDATWHYFRELNRQSGLQDLQLADHPGYKYAPQPLGPVTVLHDGDTLSVGDHRFRCLSTPGHAPDHLCLYEPRHKILFSGDHILGNITPNNTLWDAPWTVKRDLLGEYLANLDRVATLDIAIALPGHRSLIYDCHIRIAELKLHHQQRLKDILRILGDAKMNGCQVASRMPWSMRLASWEDFPATQKMFATGEALSHLAHLVFRNILAKELIDGVVYYSRLTNAA
ncbi:MAG: MBL fold metallo-hydrolase [Clostridia bacterium]|nr:MBL fold metallo-hydrolase [Clostridia bacterium]